MPNINGKVDLAKIENVIGVEMNVIIITDLIWIRTF